MRKIAKEAMCQCIIERVIWGAIKGRMCIRYKIGVQVVSYDCRSVIGAGAGAVESPDSGIYILGAKIGNPA